MGAEMIAWAVLAGVGGGLAYAGHCWLRPFAACLKCGGDGKFRSKSGRSWRRCRRCKGSGERVRVGRRVWTWLRGVKDKTVG